MDQSSQVDHIKWRLWFRNVTLCGDVQVISECPLESRMCGDHTSTLIGSHITKSPQVKNARTHLGLQMMLNEQTESFAMVFYIYYKCSFLSLSFYIYSQKHFIHAYSARCEPSLFVVFRCFFFDSLLSVGCILCSLHSPSRFGNSMLTVHNACISCSMFMKKNTHHIL